MFTAQHIDAAMERFGLPVTSRVGNSFATLSRRGLVRSARDKGKWRLTPSGKSESVQLVSHSELSALEAESSYALGAALGTAVHSIVPAALAPASLMAPVGDFLNRHSFDVNVFGMTRFPDDDENDPDPVSAALAIADGACEAHGLQFQLASDRAIVDDLWGNLAGHMWASRYGIAFFEDRRKRGLNYNLTIEVGAMLMTGRRCLLLKDVSIPRMPTDLVGFIYKSVDLDDDVSVAAAIHEWMREDLSLGACSASCT